MALRRGLRSLKSRVLRHVLLSLGVTWTLGAAVSLTVAYFFAEKAFDRSILDDAYLLASGVQLQEGGLQLAFTPGEVRTVLFDRDEVILFAVRNAEGELIAGSDELPRGAAREEQGYHFEDLQLEGRAAFRAVTMRLDRPAPFEVQVAQSTHERTALLHDLWIYSLVPQVLLLAGLMVWLRRVVAQDVEPLARLRRLLEHRHASDLAPVEVEASTHEAATLTHAVNDLLGRLADSLRAQREFTANVAHELRTPLAGIRALTEYGLRHEAPQVWREQLQSVFQAEARATRVLDKLLALALAHEAGPVLRLVPVRLDQVVEEAVLRFLPRADRQGVDLGAEGADQAVTVAGDGTLLEGILDNLIENALLHGVGAEAPEITVSLREERGAVVLAVEDNGPGMPPSEIDRMVRRGTQGDASRDRRVGGLGLALVRLYGQLLQARVGFGPGVDGRGFRCELVFGRVGGRLAPEGRAR